MCCSFLVKECGGGGKGKWCIFSKVIGIEVILIELRNKWEARKWKVFIVKYL